MSVSFKLAVQLLRNNSEVCDQLYKTFEGETYDQTCTNGKESTVNRALGGSTYPG
jgi:hypothetical protein